MPRRTDSYNLQAVNPNLAKQWHPTKNGTLTLSEITPGSRKKVWWICAKGHEWQAPVTRRAHGAGCPDCRRSFASKDYNLRKTSPELASQWHPTKNGDLSPTDVTPWSNRKAWWLCGKGHEWQAMISSRSAGNQCPYCSGRKVGEDNCLAHLNPELASQWHPTRNGSVSPKDVTLFSCRKVWWKCAKGHEWLSGVYSRSQGSGCPYCTGRLLGEDFTLDKAYPEIAAQWHPGKNGSLSPKDLTPMSYKRAWWVCEKGHAYQARVYNRSRGRGCPYCAGKAVCEENCLETVNPSLASEWHPAKNGGLTPRDVTPGSAKVVWWICESGHEWKAQINGRNRGSGCPYCARQKSNEKIE